MAWSASKIHRSFLADRLANVGAVNLASDTLKAALFDNTITPDENAASASAAFNTGVWLNTASPQIFQAGQWATGGVALTSQAVNSGTADVVFLSAANTASGSAATLANVYGTAVFDTTVTTPVASPGICYNYFGGVNSVTNGTLTVVWNASGVFRITIT